MCTVSQLSLMSCSAVSEPLSGSLSLFCEPVCLFVEGMGSHAFLLLISCLPGLVYVWKVVNLADIKMV